MQSTTSGSDLITVEVIHATPDAQVLHSTRLPAGSTVADALAATLARQVAPAELQSLAVGVWGRVVDRSFRLRQGDRVELYRPLKQDPRAARRELAAYGKVMSQPRIDLEPE